MKNHLKPILLACFLTVAISAQAQTSIGVKGGFTRAWEHYSVALPEDAKISVNGLNFSAMLYRNLGKHLAVGLEPGFVKRGAACIPGWQPIFRADRKFILNYLEAPLLVSGRFPVWRERLEVYGKAGYGWSYLASAFQEVTNFGSEDPEFRLPIKPGNYSILNRWDHGAYTALGLGMGIGPGKLLLETDFYLGMRNAEKINVSRNRSLNFNVGYVIGL